jgi:hypothetical protein
LFLVVGAASFVGVGFYLLVDELTRGKPNYTRVESGLWLGGYVDEPPPGVQAVLNLCELEDPYQAETHHWEPIRDAEPAPGLDWLRKQVEFIESQRSEGRSVFVHCRNGVSRSGMVVTAYLMRREGWSRDEALKHLRLHRPEVRPNPAFLLLLLEWEQSLRGRK